VVPKNHFRDFVDAEPSYQKQIHSFGFLNPVCPHKGTEPSIFVGRLCRQAQLLRSMELPEPSVSTCLKRNSIFRSMSTSLNKTKLPKNSCSSSVPLPSKSNSWNAAITAENGCQGQQVSDVCPHTRPAEVRHLSSQRAYRSRCLVSPVRCPCPSILHSA
jgi:hypothetical protein